MTDLVIKVDGKEVCVPENSRIIDVCPSMPQLPIMAAKVNGVIKELSEPLQNGDEVVFLDISTEDGHRIYMRGLCFLLVRAAREVLPDVLISIQHTINDGLYFEMCDSEPFSYAKIHAIKKKMLQFVADDEPFERITLTKAQAIEKYKSDGESTIVRLLKFRPFNHCQAYRNGNAIDYYYGYMPPSAGCLSSFDLMLLPPGAMLIFPSQINPYSELEFIPQPKLSRAFRQAEHWAEILRCSNVADLDEMVERQELSQFIRVSEALHEKAIAEIADKAVSSGRKIILIAGPSSSGKTTFAKRLGIQLEVNGYRPVTISLDNYYLDRDQIPEGPDGKKDLEHINTLDLPLLNEQFKALIKGETVELPIFSFPTGKRRDTGIRFKLESGQILLLEGIHGLNSSLLPLIEEDAKFKIYVSALTQLNLDNHNRIPTTDTRLLRRIVRDYNTRGSTARHTLSMWPSVRRGEEKWIFPYQENSDAMFNSALVYELLFIKKYAYPLLSTIKEDDEYFIQANRLMKFLNYFIEPGEEIDIPRNSILREFIGGSCFIDL